MKKLSHIKGIVLLLVAIFVAATLGLSLKAYNRSTAMLGQKHEKIVSRDMSKEEPFTFDDLKINNKKIKLHNKFTIDDLNKIDDTDPKTGDEKKLVEADDWLHDLEFKFINKLDTPITSFTVQLAFPETLPDGSEYAYSIRLGQWPNSPRKVGEPILIIKGDYSHIKFSRETMDDLRKFLSRGGYSLENLTKVNIGIRNIVFKDGKMWSQSDWYTPDPNIPGRYNMVKP